MVASLLVSWLILSVTFSTTSAAVEKTEDSSSEDETSRPSAGKSKERKKLRTVRDVMKKLCATTFETGPDYWLDPAFNEPVNKNVNLTFLERTYNPTNGIYYQRMILNEEQDPDVDLAILNINQGITPRLRSSSDATMLRLESRSEGWVLVLFKKLDFEDTQPNTFTIEIDTDNEYGSVRLEVVNIKDNTPYFLVDQQVCRIMENCLTSGVDAPICNQACNIFAYSIDGNVTDIAFDILENNQISEEFKLDIVQTPNSDQYNTTLAINVEKKLDFETKSFYSLMLQANDSVNVGQLVYMVEVIDMPDMPPRFTASPTIYQATEEESHTVQYRAIDGDQIVNAEISYRLFFTDEDDEQYFSIDETSGLLTIDAIDREAIQKENDMFSITVQAYETNDESSNTNVTLTVMIVDINDNIPEITPSQVGIKLDEGSSSLNLQQQQINIKVQDADLAASGTFNIELKDNPLQDIGENWYKNFLIIPLIGYQDADISISILNTANLDYENEKWRDIFLQIVATEVANSSHTSSIDFTIHLQDINDEAPEFFQESFLLEHIPEDIAKDEFLITCNATDKDFDYTDPITYSLLPATNRALRVDSSTGDVYVNMDNAFNFQQQTEIFVQILAQDSNTPPHQTYASLSIKLSSVNRNAPTIVVPPLTAQLIVQENSTQGTEVITLTATDVDETAELNLDIDWDSSYATKNGARIPDQSVYIDCFTIHSDDNDGNTADINGIISVGEKTFNWATYDMVYLVIAVTDVNTAESYEDNKRRTATLIISIQDVNDNPPEFTRTESYTNVSIRENTVQGSTVAILSATDADGPGNNDIVFSMKLKALSDNQLPLTGDFLTVNPNTGEITTGTTQIDCELFQWMVYTLTASDGVFIKDLDMNVNVIDVNDEFPVPDEVPATVPLRELSDTGSLIYAVSATDADYSEEFNTCYYFINYAATDNSYVSYFLLNSTSGHLTVNLENENNNLDIYRVGDTFSFYINIRDNMDSQLANTNYTSLRIVLQDINNHAPELPEVEFRCHELFTENEVIFSGLTAVDNDRDDINTRVTYSIEGNITCTSTKCGKEIPEDLFTITTENQKSATIRAGMDLNGYWGEYSLTIFVEDTGTDPHSLSSSKVYKLTVNGFNENTPEIIYPNETNIAVLEDQKVTNDRILDDQGNMLPKLQAYDPDQDYNGTVTFEITGDDFAKEFLYIHHEDTGNAAQLRLAKEFVTNNQYVHNLNLSACDGGNPKNCNVTSVRLLVYPGEKSAPIYNIASYNETFIENTTNPAQETTVPEPFDPDRELYLALNLPPDPIYYYIIGGNDLGLFKLDRTSGLLSVDGVLDREEQDSHQLTISASKTSSPEYDSKSTLRVFITVEDINDTPPRFSKDLYSGGIVVGDRRTKIILAVYTTDEDLNDEATYAIVDGSIKVSDSSLNNYATINSFSFIADGNTPTIRNQLSLNFDVDENLNLKGFFTFDIRATDLADNSNTVLAKVYVVSKSDQVTFVFENTADEVKDKRDAVIDVLSRVLGYTCNIDTITPSTAKAESNTTDTTDVTTHFIDMSRNEPVPASTINVRLNQQSTVQQLQREFYAYNLTYQSYQGNNNPSSEDSNIEEVLQIILIVVSVVLGTLVIILIIAFYLRTRSLNRQLDALTKTKFGSQDSGLNRADMVMPNTNRHAIEGSNPVWNEDISANDIDRQSIDSGDSDLIGVEEQPEFTPGRRESFNPIFGLGTNKGNDLDDRTSRTNGVLPSNGIRIPTTEL